MVKFSNPRALNISNEEFNAQQVQLSELRDEHYRQLVESGAADRIIASTALTNEFHNKQALTEGTILYPFRKPMWNLTIMQGYTINHDAGLPITHGGMRDPLLSIYGDKNTENYVLYIGRHEPFHGGYDQWAYAGGVLLDGMSAAVLGKNERLPFKGVEEDDLSLIEQQLNEMAALAKENDLDIIDPLTLAEGRGQIIGYDADDFC